MKKQKYLVALIIISLLSTVGYFTLYRPKTSKVISHSGKHPYDFSGPCPGETKSLKMNDVYMRGILEEGQDFNLIMNWYWCNPVKNGDLVYLKFAQGLEPVVRKVYGIPDDEFKVIFNKHQKAWNVQIGEELVMHKDQPYAFGTNDPKIPPPLKLLENSRDGVLLDREIIVFSAFPPGDRDSGTLGVVHLNDVIGKVELVH